MDILFQAVKTYGLAVYAKAAFVDQTKWSIERLEPGPGHTLNLETIKNVFQTELETMKKNKDAHVENFHAESVGILRKRNQGGPERISKRSKVSLDGSERSERSERSKDSGDVEDSGGSS